MPAPDSRQGPERIDSGDVWAPYNIGRHLLRPTALCTLMIDQCATIGCGAAGGVCIAAMRIVAARSPSPASFSRTRARFDQQEPAAGGVSQEFLMKAISIAVALAVVSTPA